METPMSLPQIVCIDTECTGTKETLHVIQFGAKTLHGPASFSKLIKPTQSIDATAKSRTGKLDSDFLGMQSADQVFEDFLLWLDTVAPFNPLLIAHNAQFDARAIMNTLLCCQNSVTRSRMMSLNIACSMSYFRGIKESCLSLDALYMKYLKSVIPGRDPHHDAEVDARALANILKSANVLPSEFIGISNNLASIGFHKKTKTRRKTCNVFETVDSMLETICSKTKAIEEVTTEIDLLESKLSKACISETCMLSELNSKLEQDIKYKETLKKYHEICHTLSALRQEHVLSKMNSSMTSDSLRTELLELKNTKSSLDADLAKVKRKLGDLSFTAKEYEGYEIKRGINPNGFIKMEQLKSFLDPEIFHSLVLHYGKLGVQIVKKEKS